MNYTRNSKYKNKNTRKVRKLIKGGDNHKIDYLSNVCLHVDNTGKSKEELQQMDPIRPMLFLKVRAHL